MEFVLTVMFLYAEPDRPPKVHLEQRASYIECDRHGWKQFQKPPDVQTVTATCVSGHLRKTWVNR